MRSPIRIALIVFSVFVVVTLGAVAYFHEAIRHMHVGFFTESDVRLLVSKAQEARAAVLQNKGCWLKIDESSIGDKKLESEMSYVAAMLDMYRVRFGVAPRNIHDLSKLTDSNQNWKLSMTKLEKDCSLYASSACSSIVTCGPSRPSDTELADFARNPEYMQRFYRLRGNEILYVPAPKC
jgi:hypothetical protein